jgi:hypothetical protein
MNCSNLTVKNEFEKFWESSGCFVERNWNRVIDVIGDLKRLLNFNKIYNI